MTGKPDIRDSLLRPGTARRELTVATRTRRPEPHEQPLTFTRADPAELARFDPATKVCEMNCGPHRDDPRSPAERKLLCGDCWPAPPEGETA